MVSSFLGWDVPIPVGSIHPSQHAGLLPSDLSSCTLLARASAMYVCGKAPPGPLPMDQCLGGGGVQQHLKPSSVPPQGCRAGRSAQGCSSHSINSGSCAVVQGCWRWSGRGGKTGETLQRSEPKGSLCAARSFSGEGCIRAEPAYGRFSL